MVETFANAIINPVTCCINKPTTWGELVRYATHRMSGLCVGLLQVARLETALQQKDSALKSAATSQREAAEALSRARGDAQDAQRESADLRRRVSALEAAAASEEAAESDAIRELRRQVPTYIALKVMLVTKFLTSASAVASLIIKPISHSLEQDLLPSQPIVHRMEASLEVVHAYWRTCVS